MFDKERLNISKYYELSYKPNKIKFDHAQKKLEELLKDSIRLRMRSDVEIVSTLTSGLDSSSIVCLMDQMTDEAITTYTCFSDADSFTEQDKKNFSFNIDLNEAKALKHFESLNLNKKTIEVNQKHYLKNLRECIYHLEVGHASPAIVSISQLYKKVHKNKHKVLFEGQGADEILGGYVTEIFHLSFLRNLLRLKLKTVLRDFQLIRRTFTIRQIILRFFNKVSKQNNLLIRAKVWLMNTHVTRRINFQKAIRFKNIFHEYQTQVLPNLLIYGDALSMANSIETRLPFMDYRIVDFANSLPIQYKVNKEKGKFILREAMKKTLPYEIYASKIKNGFATPVDGIMKSDNEIKKLLYSDVAKKFFNDKKLKQVLDKYYSGKFKHELFIFKILTIKIWFQTFISNSS